MSNIPNKDRCNMFPNKIITNINDEKSRDIIIWADVGA